MALFCRSHQKFQPFADLPLPGELAEHWRSQRDFEGSIGFRRFHGPVRGNLITSNQKLRTTRFVVWQSSRGSAGCQPAIVGSLSTRLCFRVAHVSRVLAMTSRHRGLRKIEDITPRKSTVMQSLLSFANDAGHSPASMDTRTTVSTRRRKSEPDWRYTRDACVTRNYRYRAFPCPLTQSSSSTPVRSRGAARYNPPDRRRSGSSSNRDHPV